jgi:hypothetical protein
MKYGVVGKMIKVTPCENKNKIKIENTPEDEPEVGRLFR